MIGRTALSVLALLGLATTALCSQPVVVIDPGHPAGPRDPGLKGKKLSEVQANFHIATLLVKLLKTQGITAIITRPDIRLQMTNKRRAEIANWAKADFFVRLHCDQTTGSGYAVIYPAAQGTAPDGQKGPGKQVIVASAKMASLFHKAMASSLKGELLDNGVKTDAQTPVGAKQGALTGSIYSQVPTILVNMVVLGSAHDEAWISNRKNVPKLVEALDKGVLAALEMNQE